MSRMTCPSRLSARPPLHDDELVIGKQTSHKNTSYCLKHHLPAQFKKRCIVVCKCVFMSLCARAK